MNHVGTHPEITKTEILGSPVNEQEKIICEGCERQVISIDYCQRRDCHNKRCNKCLSIRTEPFDKQRYLLCEGCTEDFDEMFKDIINDHDKADS